MLLLLLREADREDFAEDDVEVAAKDELAVIVVKVDPLSAMEKVFVAVIT